MCKDQKHGVKKVEEEKLNVVEMLMVRWSCGVSRMGRECSNITNEKSHWNFREDTGKASSMVLTCNA